MCSSSCLPWRAASLQRAIGATLIAVLLISCEEKDKHAPNPQPPSKDSTLSDQVPQELWTDENERAVEELRVAIRSATEEGRYDIKSNMSEPSSDKRREDPLARDIGRPEPLARDRSTANRLAIYVFNIGQADSMLAIGPTGKTLLMDLGEPRGGTKPPNFESGRTTVLERISELTGSSHIDYFVVSHYHQDHVGMVGRNQDSWGGGIIGLLSNYDIRFSVGEFIHIGADGANYMKSGDKRASYKGIEKLMPLWKQYGRVISDAKPRFGTDQINLGEGVSVEILAFAGTTPDGKTAFEKAEQAGADYSRFPGSENDLSIALKITAGEFEFFTAGDLTGTDDPVLHPLYNVTEHHETYTNVEHHLVDYWSAAGLKLDVEVYRANHHGSKNSSTLRLVDALDPEFVLYSTGAQYKHPDTSTLDRCVGTARQFATTAVTDKSAFGQARGETKGEIVIIVPREGNEYQINGETHRAFTNDDESNNEDVGEEDARH